MGARRGLADRLAVADQRADHDRLRQVLLDKTIITNAMFTALLLMAVGSTMLTIPIVSPTLKRMRMTVSRIA